MKSRPSREDEWVERWTRSLRNLPLPGLRHGIGHDCAVLASPDRRLDLVLKTDAVIEGVHFLRSTPAPQVGRKAIARALSDLAAAGATPRAALVTAGCPNPKSAARLQAVYRGLASAARRWQVAIVGGETVRTRQLLLSVSLLGTVPRGRSPHRAGARPGHRLFVTGSLGGSWPHRHLTFTPRLREGGWLVGKNFPSAMMDLSDGLGADLPRLARASRIGFRIFPERLPLASGATRRQAITQGEDYELLFSVPSAKVERLRRSWPFSTRLTEIGICLPARSGFHSSGIPLRGYDHLA
ncbi:MAG: thiamine-monophosphate kinase [Verrucomicrobia bacterium]|nr:thiamine-monophosphate kinase [Verrucomicrobiota bacterium]NDD81127.1 thiamine-monophosphate kinase [Verrucomicrobiota bacterium]